MKRIEKKPIHDAADAVRDFRSWNAVFVQEYNLPTEAENTLHKKIDELAQKLAAIDCADYEKTVKDAEDQVRELKNWIAVFSRSYSLPAEATTKLNTQMDKIAALIAKITCK